MIVETIETTESGFTFETHIVSAALHNSEYAYRPSMLALRRDGTPRKSGYVRQYVRTKTPCSSTVSPGLYGIQWAPTKKRLPPIL